MTGGKKDNSKSRLKRAAEEWLEGGAEAHEDALQAWKRKRRGKSADGASAAPGRPKQAKGTRSKPEKSGRVVSIGLAVPTISELEAGDMGGPGAGRPTDYLPHYTEVARGMCRLGATDFDLAQEFGVKTQTIWNWRCKHPEFFDATLEGKEAFDGRAERSLAQRAVGYSYHSEKVFQYEGRIVRAQIVEHVPPDIGALRLWLMNRRPDKWRAKEELKLDGSDAFLKLWSAISDGSIEKMLGK